MLTTRTIHSLMNPADGAPDVDFTSADDILRLLPMRPTPEAWQLFKDAELIYAVDVMSRATEVIFGEEFSPDGRLRRELAIELDIEGEVPHFVWLLGLTKAIKGRVDFRFVPFDVTTKPTSSGFSARSTLRNDLNSKSDQLRSTPGPDTSNNFENRYGVLPQSQADGWLRNLSLGLGT